MLSPGKIYVNTVLRLTVSFTDEDGVAVNPTTVTFKLMSPCCCGSTSYEYGVDANITRPSTGNYIAEIQPDEAGVWSWRWETTGTGTTVANEGTFNVQRSRFYDDCCWDYR